MSYSSLYFLVPEHGKHKCLIAWLIEYKIMKSTVLRVKRCLEVIYLGPHLTEEDTKEGTFKVRKGNIQEQDPSPKAGLCYSVLGFYCIMQVLYLFKSPCSVIAKVNKGCPNLHCWMSLPLQKYL